MQSGFGPEDALATVFRRLVSATPGEDTVGVRKKPTAGVQAGER
jgi:hypothetical protein